MYFPVSMFDHLKRKAHYLLSVSNVFFCSSVYTLKLAKMGQSTQSF